MNIKKVALYTVVAAVLMIVSVELLSLAASLIMGDIYDRREVVLDRLNQEDFEAFALEYGDPVLGWDSRGPKVAHDTSCIGTPVTYTYDAFGARIYSDYRSEDVGVIVVGDSYTVGAEANDDEAYPAQLAPLLGTSIANHGVGGYGPALGFLNFREKAGLYPDARVAVLGIMYENIYRMMNSYWPVLYDTFDYGLKAHMSGGAITGFPGAEAFTDLAKFRARADIAYDRDFWAKPELTFPWTLSLYEALNTNYFYFRVVQKNLRSFGVPEYTLAYKSERFAQNLVSILNQFSEVSVSHNLLPVVLFIPRNGFDTNSPSEFLTRYGAGIDESLVVIDVGKALIDWDRFNIRADDSSNICHPSAYGYREIAKYLAETLRGLSDWPLSE